MVMSGKSGCLGYDQNGDGNDVKPPPPPSQHENGESSEPNSIFSFTLDEIQSKSGKSFGSMNMDEFLANIWSVDENQVCEEQPNQETASNNGKDTTSKSSGSLSRQGSFSIPTPLCKKTVDEVWSEIDKTQQPPPLNEASIKSGLPQRQPTIREITLEDFLVKAGIVQERPQKNMESNRVQSQAGNTNCIMGVGSSTYGDTTHTSFGMGNSVIGSGSFNPQFFQPNRLSGDGYASSPYPMFSESKMVLGEASFGETRSTIETCHSLMESSGTSNKKRILDGPPEVLVERRQRRIKNRESAARSRARKQAYTVELEAELNQLQEENFKLKHCLAEIEQKRKQEIMRRKQTRRAQKLAAKLRTIRRVASA